MVAWVPWSKWRNRPNVLVSFFLFEDDMETLRRIVPFHARDKIRERMVMRIETKDTQERLRKEI